jgi:predicted ribosomally synthesized peptide with nif11-like leader
MSIENAQNFLERMKTDQDFKKKVSGATGKERKKIITEAGFDFTDKELEQVRGELDESELEKVAGGGQDCQIDTCSHQCFPFCNVDCNGEACGTQQG